MMKFNSLPKLASLLTFVLMSIFASGQGGEAVKLPESVFPNRFLEFRSKAYLIGDKGQLAKRHFEIFEREENGEFKQRYISPESRVIWKSVSDLSSHVFILSFYAVSPPEKYFITALGANMEFDWDYEIDGGTVLVTSITPDMQGGCYASLQTDGELKCIHLNARGLCDWSHSFGIGPVKESIFQLDYGLGGVAGFVTTRSELSGVVNRCTPDYDYLGFVGLLRRPIDTLFSVDVHPYSNFMRYEILESPPDGKIFFLKAQLQVDAAKSSIQYCDNFDQPKIDFRNIQDDKYPLMHSNRMVYSTGTKSIEIWDVKAKQKLEVMIDDRWGYPQRVIASQEEDGIIWNAIGNDSIKKISLDSETIWNTRIPNPSGTKTIVIQIGYRKSGGYFVVTQAAVGGQQYYFELDRNGNWLH